MVLVGGAGVGLIVHCNMTCRRQSRPQCGFGLSALVEPLGGPDSVLLVRAAVAEALGTIGLEPHTTCLAMIQVLEANKIRFFKTACAARSRKVFLMQLPLLD